MKKLHLTAALTASAVLAFTGTAFAKTLSYSNPFPSAHTVQASGVDHFAKAIEESSGGELRMRIHSGGVLASGPATLAALQRGTADSGLVVSAWVPSQLPATVLASQFQIAMLDPRVAAAAANEFYLLRCPECIEENERHQNTPLAYYSSATYNFMCRRPLDSLEDLSRMRVRATSTPLVTWVEQFDATVVAVPTGDIYQALQRGQADCTVGPLSYLRTLNLREVIQWVSDLEFGAYYAATALSMNTRTWEGLNDNQRKAVVGNLAGLVRNTVEGYMADSDSSRELGMKEGVVFAQPSDAERQILADHIANEYDRVLAAAKEQGLDNPEEFLDRFLQVVDKWEAIVADIGDDFDAYEAALQREIYSNF